MDNEQTAGVEKCKVAMYVAGAPAGTCGNDAYGEQTQEYLDRFPDWDRWRQAVNCAGPACPGHGGPKQKDVAHKGDPCIYCDQAHDDVDAGPCPELVKQI